MHYHHAPGKFPIIHIIGLPGAGKTTLARRLSRRLRLPVLGISTYRSRFADSAEGEADAWLALYRDLSRRHWRNCIVETTGVNRRASFLRDALPFGRVVIVKLVASKKTLLERIVRKRTSEQGGSGWVFGGEYMDKRDFMRQSFDRFKELPADVTIDTSRLSAARVYARALKEIQALRAFMARLSGSDDAPGAERATGSAATRVKARAAAPLFRRRAHRSFSVAGCSSIRP